MISLVNLARSAVGSEDGSVHAAKPPNPTTVTAVTAQQARSERNNEHDKGNDMGDS